jgi:hypothetical protein
MKGIAHDKLNKVWIVNDAWGVFFGLSAAVTVICIIIGLIDAIL